MQWILTTLAKPFLGTGIGTKVPWLHAAYKHLYTNSSNATQVVRLQNNLSLTIQANDTGPGLYFRTHGAYETLITTLIQNYVDTDDVFIDVGAHVGIYTLLASTQVGPKGKVISVEPATENLRLLKQNIAINDISNCTVIEKAAYKKTGTVSFFTSPTSSGEHSLEHKKGYTKHTVKATTIDAIVKTLSKAPRLIKIDVEGAEKDVLLGMKKTLRKKTLTGVIIEVTNDTYAFVANTLSASRFTLSLINEQTGIIDAYSQPAAESLIRQFGYINLFALRLPYEH